MRKNNYVGEMCGNSFVAPKVGKNYITKRIPNFLIYDRAFSSSHQLIF